MPKKSKKEDKKSVKKIPAKAGAKAKVKSGGKVEVILPVDRSRGPYRPRKTEEEKLKEQLRAIERRDYAQQVLAPRQVAGTYRSGGSIYRNEPTAPTGGWTGLSKDKNTERLKAVESKLDKLLEKKKEEPKEEEPKKVEPVRRPLIEEVSTRPLATRRRTNTTTPLTGQTVRPKQKQSIVSDIGSGVSALASAGIGLATAGVSGVLSSAEREIDSGRERVREVNITRQKEEQERKEKERKQAITDSTQARLKKVDERLKTGIGIVDSIMGGEREKVLTLRAEPNPERERRELQRRQKALEDDKNRKDKEEAFKERERIKREEHELKKQERQQLKKEAYDLQKQEQDIGDLFSELEEAPRKPPKAITIEELDTDDDFQSAEEEAPTPPPRERVKEKKPPAPEIPPRDEPPALPPRDAEYEERRQQILQDQEIARNLLREEARNRDRKIKQAQERENELSKLNRDFIAHKNREDRNARRREQRRKDKEVEEEVEKIVLGGATAGLIEKAPVQANRGRKVDINKLIQSGANRQDIEDYEQDNKQRKRLVDGIYSAFGINLTGTGGGLDYVKSGTSKDKRIQIRRDSVRKLRERGLLANQIQEFTRTLDRIDELIERRDDFGNRFQRRGGAVELRPAGGTGQRGRPRGGGRGRGRGERVGRQVEEIEERERRDGD